jgi:hypothetical protein
MHWELPHASPNHRCQPTSSASLSTAMHWTLPARVCASQVQQPMQNSASGSVCRMAHTSAAHQQQTPTKQLRSVAILGQASLQRSPRLSSPFLGHSRTQSTLRLRQVIQQSHPQRQHCLSIPATTVVSMLLSALVQAQLCIQQLTSSRNQAARRPALHQRASKIQQPTHRRQRALNATRGCQQHDRGSTYLLLQQQHLHRVRLRDSHKCSSAPGQRQQKQQVWQRQLWWQTLSRPAIQLNVSSSSSTSSSISSICSATVRDGWQSHQLTLWRQQQWQHDRTAQHILAQCVTTCSGTVSHRTTCTSTSTRCGVAPAVAAFTCTERAIGIHPYA